MSGDRFKGPCAADELATCEGCGDEFHYETLDEKGYCPDCKPEPKDDDEESD